MREAGEKLLRTSSAISQSITTLERSLDIKLFRRSGIRLELTEVGERILMQIKANESGLKALFDEISSGPKAVRGRVSLGLPPGYPALSISNGLSQALLKHPDLQLRLRFLSHAKLADDLIRNQLEVAVSLQPLRQWNRRIKSVGFCEENLILAVPRALKHLCTQTHHELPVVDYYQTPLLIEGWLKHHKQKKLKTKIRVYGSNLDHVLQMVRKGIGCAVVPRHIIANELSQGKLLEHALDKLNPWTVRVWLNIAGKPEELSPCANAIWNALLV